MLSAVSLNSIADTPGVIIWPGIVHRCQVCIANSVAVPTCTSASHCHTFHIALLRLWTRERPRYDLRIENIIPAATYDR